MSEKADVVWCDDENDAGYAKCAAAVWKIAEELARKFLSRRSVPGYDVDDLAAEAVIHVLIVRRSDLRRAIDPWKYIRRAMWNRMNDIARHMRLEAVDVSDAELEALAEKQPDLAAIRREEIHRLEEFIDAALAKLPQYPCRYALLLRLRFGMWRRDDLCAEFPQIDEQVSLARLADWGEFGDSEVAVHRRVLEALERLREILIARLKRERISNFNGYHVAELQTAA